MPEKVAIVGSREGADLEHVVSFVQALHAKQPDTILISGGAPGVDTTAEQAWLTLHGEVWSYRPKKLEDYNHDPQYGIEKWELGAAPRVFDLISEPTWADYRSACLYRDWLIAAECERLVAFYRHGKSPGAAFTAELATNWGKHVYEFENDRATAAD